MVEELKRNKKLIIPIILVTLVFILGAAYAWLTTVLNGTKINKITAGTLELTLDDNASDGIDLEYAIPQSNEQGLSNTAYTFTVKNTGSINAAYKLYLEDEEIEGTRIDDSNIKYNLVKNSGENNPKLLSTTIEDNKRVLESTIIDGNSTNTYSLKLWIGSEATQSEVANKVFKARIKLEAVQSEDSSDDEYEVKGKIEKEEEPKTCEGGSVVVYPSGTTATLDNECNFTIPSLKPGEYTIYYVPSGVDPNRPEEEIKNDPLVIPTRIIVGIDPRVIKPAQGYDMILDVIKNEAEQYVDSETPITRASDAVAPQNDAWLRYKLTDGEIAPETVPEVCATGTYNNNSTGTICLKNNEYEASVNKLNNTIISSFCNEDSNAYTCSTSAGALTTAFGLEAYPDGYVAAMDYEPTPYHGPFGCAVNSNNVARCGNFEYGLAEMHYNYK